MMFKIMIAENTKGVHVDRTEERAKDLALRYASIK